MEWLIVDRLVVEEVSDGGMLSFLQTMGFDTIEGPNGMGGNPIRVGITNMKIDKNNLTCWLNEESLYL